MIVKDLIFSCSSEAIMRELKKIEHVDDKHYSKMCDLYSTVLQQLRSIVPNETDQTLMGLYFSDNNDEKVFDVVLYDNKEVEEKRDTVLKLSGIGNVESLAWDELERLCRVDLPGSFSFVLSSWSDVLGYELSQENVDDVGAEKFAAEILYEMTFFGLSQEDVELEREKVLLSLKDESGWKDPSSEDEDERFWTPENVFGTDMRTEEEKEKERRNSCVSLANASVGIAKAIKKYMLN